jgi:hypothetical protein
MKKGYTLLWSLILILAVFAVGCKTKVKPVSERIAKTWTAETVKEGAAVVYTKGGSNNTQPGYIDYRLIIVPGGTATLIDRDKFSSTGTWELTGDTKLTLKNLTPAPTGTGGTIDFTIDSLDDSKLVLTRTTPSTKTGGTLNVYTLSNP